VRLHYLSLDEVSGYAVSARRFMRALEDAGAEVRWVPFVPGPAWGLGYEPAARPGVGVAGCDAVVAHLVPEYWPLVRELYPHAPLVGHTVWETDRLPRHWPALLDVADLVVVPTAWNLEVMRSEGVRAPIRVVPHIAIRPRRVGSPTWRAIPDGAFVVYTIAPWTARKALGETVRAYQRAFAGRGDTLLVVKTSPEDFTARHADGQGPAGPGSSAFALARVLGEFQAPAPVRLVTRELADNEIDALHARGDCYLSLCRSEGWGNPPFDAAAFGNPVVITGFGGQLDYLDTETAFLVDYELVPVEDPSGGGSYTPDQRWAEPSSEHAAALLRQVEGERVEAAARAELARIRVLRDFDGSIVAAAFLRALAEL
jgi:glycosyltransferase involved in cell wall biosynthesis